MNLLIAYIGARSIQSSIFHPFTYGIVGTAIMNIVPSISKTPVELNKKPLHGRPEFPRINR